MNPSTRRLEIAVGAAVVEVLAQVALLVARGALGAVPLRVVFLGAKLPFCLAAWRRHPGGYLALWIWEIGGLVAALSAHGSLSPRLAIAVAAIVVMALLGRAISAFPSVEWKPR
ncbi:MAG TPA: hypothetical protein VHD87_09325 [Acidimicrobiales bacterium]|nr:hypothetical protein [Acidimicrobiales bacterium]